MKTPDRAWLSKNLDLMFGQLHAVAVNVLAKKKVLVNGTEEAKPQSMTVSSASPSQATAPITPSSAPATTSTSAAATEISSNATPNSAVAGEAMQEIMKSQNNNAIDAVEAARHEQLMAECQKLRSCFFNAEGGLMDVVEV